MTAAPSVGASVGSMCGGRWPEMHPPRRVGQNKKYLEILGFHTSSSPEKGSTGGGELKT